MCIGKLPDKNGFLFMVSFKCPWGEPKVNTQNSIFGEAREEIDALAREYRDTHDPKIPEEIWKLARQLRELDH